VPKAGNTTERGYGNAHQKERRRLTPTVERGEAYCAQPTCVMPSRWIQPGTRWALGHSDDRTTWIGPVHHRCNQLDGASKGGQATTGRIINTCITCGTRFKAWTPTQRHCSHRCRHPQPRVTDDQQRITTCQGCGTTIVGTTRGRPRKWCDTCATRAVKVYAARYRAKTQQTYSNTRSTQPSSNAW
jgi:hypothetical protein